jgi:hypothetical protein
VVRQSLFWPDDATLLSLFLFGICHARGGSSRGGLRRPGRPAAAMQKIYKRKIGPACRLSRRLIANSQKSSCIHRRVCSTTRRFLLRRPVYFAVSFRNSPTMPVAVQNIHASARPQRRRLSDLLFFFGKKGLISLWIMCEQENTFSKIKKSIFQLCRDSVQCFDLELYRYVKGLRM